MKYADLHVHSSYSDGIYTPEEIVDFAIKNKVSNIAITDHDSLASQYILNYKSKDINIISGIELSTEFNDIELHMLGYFIDVQNKDLIAAVNELNKGRIKRVEEILYKLRKNNIDISLEDLNFNINSNVTIGRSHIANAMVKKGYFDNYKTAFTSFLVRGKPGYVKGTKINYKECIKVINDAGGMAVLAHPGQIYRKREVENILRELKCFGLKGVEVYHPSHSIEDSNKFYSMAQKYKLSVSGGSDFHGKQIYEYEPTLGSFGLDKDKFLKFINYKR